MGVWIEIVLASRRTAGYRSLPAWECGLKLIWVTNKAQQHTVTPCVGVWIEITYLLQVLFAVDVTPCVGVWIEISTTI